MLKLYSQLTRATAVLLLLNLCSTCCAEAPFRVMSFNIRYGTANDGENHWNHRKEFVRDTILAFGPDLLGTQETLDFQRDYLAEQLPGYDVFGAGRDDGENQGEMMAIFYRRDRFEKLDGGHFWYSETPSVPGSKAWDSSLPRMASWLKLKDRKNGETLYFFNTHFDHRGQQAREESAKLLRRKIGEIAAKSAAIVTGDFNAPPDGRVYQNLFGEQSAKVALVDTYRSQHPDGQETMGTAGGFQIRSRGTRRIDWIACTPHFEIVSAGIDRTNRDGRTPSDHDPVTSVLKLTE